MGDLPEALRNDAEMYAGCVAGAIQTKTYLRFIKECGFENVTLQKEKPSSIPDDILRRYLSEDELVAFAEGSSGMSSITGFAQQPGAAMREADTHYMDATARDCLPGSGCC